MEQKSKSMEKPLIDTYNGNTIYIYFETFEANPYVICSYNDNGTKKFKLNKSEL
jgi:hypothetical protein